MFAFQYSSTIVLAVMSITCRAVPVSPLFADSKAEKESQGFNEVGPEEDWKVLTQFSKSKAYDPSDIAQTKALMKEIEGFSRLVTQSNAVTADAADEVTTGLPDDVTETDSASSDWFGSTWKTLIQNADGDVFRAQSEGQDDGNVEEIIKKISNDLKKLYAKIKRVITVVKNWYALWDIANTVMAVAG